MYLYAAFYAEYTAYASFVEFCWHIYFVKLSLASSDDFNEADSFQKSIYLF